MHNDFGLVFHTHEHLLEIHFKTVTFATNTFSTWLTKEERVFVCGLQLVVPKQSLKANDTFFPFEIHCYFLKMYFTLRNQACFC